MVADQAQLFVHLVVVSNDDASVAPDIQVLQRMQGKASCDTPGPRPLAVGFRKNALTGILNDRQVVLLGDLHQRRHIGDLAGQLYRHDRFGVFGDRGFDLTDVHAKAVVAIDQHRRRADFVDSADGGNEGVGGGDHFVAESNAERAQWKLQRIGARPDAYGVLGADKCSELFLELADRLAEREIAGCDQPPQLFKNVARFGELLRQIGITCLELHDQLVLLELSFFCVSALRTVSAIPGAWSPK